MRTTTLDATIMETTCGYSQRGMSHFVSTCGRTETHEEKCLRNVEDYFGNVAYEEINRPLICHFLHDVYRLQMIIIENCKAC